VFSVPPEPFFFIDEAFAGLLSHKSFCTDHMRKLAVE